MEIINTPFFQGKRCSPFYCLQSWKRGVLPPVGVRWRRRRWTVMPMTQAAACGASESRCRRWNCLKHRSQPSIVPAKYGGQLLPSGCISFIHFWCNLVAVKCDYSYAAADTMFCIIDGVLHIFIFVEPWYLLHFHSFNSRWQEMNLFLFLQFWTWTKAQWNYNTHTHFHTFICIAKSSTAGVPASSNRRKISSSATPSPSTSSERRNESISLTPMKWSRTSDLKKSCISLHFENYIRKDQTQFIRTRIRGNT